MANEKRIDVCRFVLLSEDGDHADTKKLVIFGAGYQNRTRNPSHKELVESFSNNPTYELKYAGYVGFVEA